LRGVGSHSARPWSFTSAATRGTGPDNDVVDDDDADAADDVDDIDDDDDNDDDRDDEKEKRGRMGGGHANEDEDEDEDKDEDETGGVEKSRGKRAKEARERREEAGPTAVGGKGRRWRGRRRGSCWGRGSRKEMWGERRAREG
jgi:hypothetical protein